MHDYCVQLAAINDCYSHGVRFFAETLFSRRARFPALFSHNLASKTPTVCSLNNKMYYSHDKGRLFSPFLLFTGEAKSHNKRHGSSNERRIMEGIDRHTMSFISTDAAIVGAGDGYSKLLNH